MPLPVTTLEPRPEEVIGASVVALGHSEYGKPVFVVEGIGPAAFRSHYVALSSGVVLDLCTVEITKATPAEMKVPGESEGLPLDQVIGRTVTALARDDVHSSIVILDGGLFLADGHDIFYRNPLVVGRLRERYTASELAQFIDYWTEQPLAIAGA